MQVPLMMELLTNLLGIPVTELTDEERSCTQFERSHCFSAQIQVQLTAPALELFCQSIKEHCLYEIHDRLGLRGILFRTDKRTILAGPYVSEEWSDARGQEILIRNGLPAKQLIPYKLYYCSYQVSATADILHCIRAAVKTLFEDKTPYRYQAIAGLHDQPSPAAEDVHPSNFEQILAQYEAENDMIRMVRKGDTEGAKKAKQRAVAASAESTLHYVTRENILAGVSITRTLIRKAAESAGVHPAVVDAISREYEQKAADCKDIAQGRRLTDAMLEAYCAAVRTVQKENYSPIVRRTADYIQMHLSSPLRSGKIASMLGIGQTQLERLFKAETGSTITGYVAVQRCRQAAELLRSTSLNIQDISGYVGYPDNNYFVKVFKTQYHMTPTEYRRRYQSISSFPK